MLPAGVNPVERRMLFPGTDFEIPMPSTVSIIGFIAAWMAVGVMILTFVWIVK